MILDKIVEDKRIRLPQHKAVISEPRMRELAERAVGAQRTWNRADAEQCGDFGADAFAPCHAEVSFYDNLRKPGISIIGEFKKASPSLGKIESKIDLMARIEEYSASVDAISCLTEEDHFLGNTDYLKQIRAKSPLPILRKDFMIDEYQFYEAKVIGADAVLLITAILDDVQMHDFYQLARSLELDVLVETHDEEEIARALKIDPRIIGVNNRNLKDFSISLENTGRLRKYIPEDKVYVAESGIMGDGDVQFLKDAGVDGFLIGRAFMEADNPGSLARRWKMG